jgi:hypothetical protein
MPLCASSHILRMRLILKPQAQSLGNTSQPKSQPTRAAVLTAICSHPPSQSPLAPKVPALSEKVQGSIPHSEWVQFSCADFRALAKNLSHTTHRGWNLRWLPGT